MCASRPFGKNLAPQLQVELQLDDVTAFERLRRDFANISLDTVNTTLLTSTETGAAFVVEGSRNVRCIRAANTKKMLTLEVDSEMLRQQPGRS